MPLQCDICESIQIVPMLLDMTTLRRNKFRDPRFMGAKRARFRKESALRTMRKVRGIHAASVWYLRMHSNCSDALGHGDVEAE